MDKSPSSLDTEATAASSSLPAGQRALAQCVVDVTALLVREAASGEWDHVTTIAAARRVLLEELQNEQHGSRRSSCLDALFAAVNESEQTLRQMAAQAPRGP